MDKQIKSDQIPYEQFKQIGMSKEDVLNISKDSLKKLLRGDKTDMLDIKLNKNQQTPSEVKLSLERNSDNSIRLIVHPYRKDLLNEYNLSDKEIEALKKGEIIEGVSKAKNGEMRPHLFQLDKDLNEIMKANKSSIEIPDKVNNIKITNEQKELIASGKSVEIKGKDGTTKIQLDLNDSKGIRIDSERGYERNGRLDTGTKKDLKY
jgi:hypothetical protein